MALRPIAPKKSGKRRTSKTRDRDEGPDNPQTYIPLAERARRRIDAATLVSLDVPEEQATVQMVENSEKRVEAYEKRSGDSCPWRALDEDGALRILQLVRKQLLDKPEDPTTEKRLMISAIKGQIPNMLAKGRWSDATRAWERLARLQGLDAPRSVKLDVTGREAMLESFGLSTMEELDELVKRGIAEREKKKADDDD